jgi:hypothetical protein
VVAKELLHRQKYSHDLGGVLTEHEGFPFEISIQGPPNSNDADNGGHHIWLSGPELQGLTNYQTKDPLTSALAFL